MSDHAGQASAAELAMEMTAMLAGFQRSQALYVMAELDLASALLDGPRSTAELAVAAGVPEEGLRRLLGTLTGAGVVRHAPGDAFTVTPVGATLADGTPGSVRTLALTWMKTRYGPFSRLLDVVRTGQDGAQLHYGTSYFEHLAGDPHRLRWERQPFRAAGCPPRAAGCPTDPPPSGRGGASRRGVRRRCRADRPVGGGELESAPDGTDRPVLAVSGIAGLGGVPGRGGGAGSHGVDPDAARTVLGGPRAGQLPQRGRGRRVHRPERCRSGPSRI